MRNPESQLNVTLDMVLSHYRQTHPRVCYMQVGAFDGVSGDPIYPLIEKHALTGFLIEPQPDAFERLKANYAPFGRSFVFVNAAVAANDGCVPIYIVKREADGPEWLHQIASFDRSIVMKHAAEVPGLEAMIQVETVRSVTFGTLFREFGIDRIDLLQIDAEGYDAEILRLYDVRSRKPAIVRFEHKHLRDREHEQALRELIDCGYKIAVCGGDTLAYHEPTEN
jgi:FkbM family methyltransferase